MAIAWSRISSKVIAHPPYTNEVCRRRCGNGTSHLGGMLGIPHMGDKRKQEVLGSTCRRGNADLTDTRGRVSCMLGQIPTSTDPRRSRECTISPLWPVPLLRYAIVSTGTERKLCG